MTIEDIQNLIYGDEGRILELKKTTGELKDGTKSACAFLNTDGGPRKNMNTAQLLQRFAEGAKSVCEEIEAKVVRLYDLDYKGCMSCMACKVKDKASNICRFKDGLTHLLEEIAQADGLVLGSPIYFGEVTDRCKARMA